MGNSISEAMMWVSRITTAALLMSAPPILGGWADTSWGTQPIFTLFGLTFGFIAGGLSIVNFIQSNKDKK